MKLPPIFFLLLTALTLVSAQPDSSFYFGTKKLNTPVDVFPLAVGNHWTYGYSWHSFDWIGEYYDSGTVAIQVISKTRTEDSTRWLLQQTSHLWSWSYLGSPGEPKIIMDSVELIELHQGQHQLYIAAEMDKITRSVFPFFRYRDTVVLRFLPVSDNGTVTVFSQARILPGIISYTFQQGVGLSSVSLSDGCTCLTGYTGNNTLRDYIITSIAKPSEELSTEGFQLYQNYPNPFNPTTIIEYQIPNQSFVALKIFDLLGREVATLVNGEINGGRYSVEWDASHEASGIYLYRLQVGNYSAEKKLVVIK